MKFQNLASVLALSGLSMGATSTDTASAAVTTYSLVISRYGAFFTKVMTSTVGQSIDYVDQYLSDSNILAYTIGDSSGSAAFYSRASVLSSESSASAAKAEATATTTTESSSSEEETSTSASETSTESSSSSTSSSNGAAGLQLGTISAAMGLSVCLMLL
ncbi:hypothetical protein KL905_004259 [Ogataea polymorpha]|uniref:Uncharacterized protein n=1 Tax=Ogataea polymorpha TaxID=460523 RepID=A0A1B7SKA1_9ASCO|nr:uncharacterized protein OGAPODRAFT_8162 [Ogataea polymorpha]KAG7878401.1 hypothetical protein KL937_003643 [Ogataea polymorpha]KAG7887653.1 hypothetical protein KL936_004350 [Ogataea polymorpha]KAG7890344.1 hypothetical protein KL908_004181 [Ogataea polymorpha]KAG7899088.1 hypothetical protein KL935_004096 [Ogataea polymorpha]KAG7907219.1 hypothetical protein KL906_003906 [Ogataea polymorpha]